MTRRAVPCPFCKAGHLRQTQYFRTLQCDACRTGTVQLEGPGRIGCLVPFCRATRGGRKGERPLDDKSEWVCGKHWRMIPAALKAQDRRMMKRLRIILRYRPEYREWWKLPPGSPERISALAVWKRERSGWRRLAAAAIEAAGGIG